MVTFKTTGLENTDETLKIAVAYAKEHSCDIVAATSTGNTIVKLKDKTNNSPHGFSVWGVFFWQGS